MYILAGILVIVVVLFLIGKGFHRTSRRKKLSASPIPDNWKNILDKNIYLYRHLPSSLKEQLHGLINVFLAEKQFEGCGGLEITDEIKVTIAGEACMLMLNRKPTYYPTLYSIFVYPHTFVGGKNSLTQDGLIRERRSARLGESWQRGPLVVAWDTVIENARNSRDGHNVVLHEFAHQLDNEDGKVDGAPELKKPARYKEWAQILGKEFKKLRKNVQFHKKSVLDYYGATNPAEFFAVATEAFYTKPKELQTKEPELYEELRKYYRIDPSTW